MFKLFCSDFDNTIAKSKKISPANQKAVLDLQKAGIQFALVTGRPIANAMKYLKRYDLPLNMVANNGSVAVLNSLPLSPLALDGPVLWDLLELFQQKRWFYLAYGMDTCYFPSYTPLLEGGLLARAIERVSSMPLKRIKSKDLGHFAAHTPILKISLYPLGSKVSEVWKELEKNPYLYITTSSIHKLEISAAGVSKWRGILSLAHPFGVSPQEIATIGDFYNDLPMLEEAAYSFAMGNAPQAVQEAAKEVVAPVQEDGFAQACYRLIAINRERAQAQAQAEA